MNLWPAMSSRRISLRQRLTGFAILLTSLSMGAACLLDYRLSRKSLEEHLAKELLAMVVSVAPLIDGDAVLRIDYDFEGEITNREEFESIRSLLLKVKQSNRLESNGSPLYIMRPTEAFASKGELEFVVMTDRDENGRFFVGNKYHALAHNREALLGRAATTGVYEDPLGLWISAAAPIRNRTGKVIGILQADRPVQYFYEQSRRQALLMLGVAALSLALGSIVAGWMARGISSPVHELVTATQRLAAGELHRRVELRRTDELGDLGHSINEMAIQLQAAHEKQMIQQDELIKAWRNAEAASRAKSQFLTTMSHELRTPLNGIIGFAGVLVDSGLSPDQRRCAETIELSGNNLLAIVNDVLDYSKIEAGKLVLENQVFELVPLIESAADTLSVSAHAKGLELTCCLGPTLPKYAQGDPLRLRQVLINLLGNAIKFTHEGDVTVRAEARPLEGAAFELSVAVEDTGIGIDRETQARLFQPFSQADASTTRRYGGSGLGLSICQRLLAAMGGEISVESNPGRGSRFRFSVPLGLGSDTAYTPLPAIDADPPNVLVVANHDTSRDQLVSYLTEWGLTVESLDSQEAAHRQDVGITIISASGSSEATVQWLRALTDIRPARDLILLCSNLDRPAQETLDRLGIVECLPKPVKQSSLREALERTCARRHGRSSGPAGQAEPSQPPATAQQARPLAILVAEDNLVNSQLVLRLLRGMGYEPDHAENGSAAVRAARGKNYDLILMDCQMPEMDGYEATRQIRLHERETGHRARIVAMTANALPGDREKCLNSGMDDYLSKPFRKTDLATEVESCGARASQESQGIGV